MFRIALAPVLRLTHLSSAYHVTSVLQTEPKKKYIPADWLIVDGGPGGGLELAFFHRKGPEATGYTPEGMTAEEILAIPGAKEWWSTIEEVQEYIEERAAAKRVSTEKDLMERFAEIQEAKDKEKKEKAKLNREKKKNSKKRENKKKPKNRDQEKD